MHAQKGKHNMIAKNDEKKRSVLWRLAMSVTSVLIILITVFFLFRMFTGNPLEGRWSYEESDLHMTVREDGVALIEWPDQWHGSQAGVEMPYDLDTETKTFALHVDEEAVKRAVEASGGTLTETAVNGALGSLEATYDYNMEHNQLTLTDREYGNKLVFDRE